MPTGTMSHRLNPAFLSKPAFPRPMARTICARTICAQRQERSPDQVRTTTTTRRHFLSMLAALPIASGMHRALAKKPADLESVTAPIVMCRRVMTAVDRYIEEGAWDKGRTNVNYCTRVLAMRRNMRDAAELLEGDAYYDALDTMGEMDNVMSQLDASLYTPLFIPGDDGAITVEQTKYQQQAREFYRLALDGFDKFLSVIPDEVLKRAVDIADRTKFEIRLELE